MLRDESNDVDLNDETNNFFSAVSPGDDEDDNDHSSFEVEVLQASLDFRKYPDMLKSGREEHDASSPVDEQRCYPDGMNTSINLPPASLIAKKQTASKNIYENISSSFIGVQSSG